jgi:uncharacterized protein
MSQSARVQIWARRLHVYTSMVALLIVLFFGVTGITLNHPTWTFGDHASHEAVTGVFPFEVLADDGSVDFLRVAEFVRSEHDVRGTVDSFDAAGGEGWINFKNAGYSAGVVFDIEDGSYDLTVDQQGLLAVMNDLHKGRDTGSSWRWVIDVSAGFLVAISLTGLVLQLVLKKRRTAALASALVGAAGCVVLIAATIA